MNFKSAEVQKVCGWGDYAATFNKPFSVVRHQPLLRCSSGYAFGAKFAGGRLNPQCVVVIAPIIAPIGDLV